MTNTSSNSNIPVAIDSEESNSINFDENNLAAGATINNQFDGIKFSSPSEFGLMIFDTNNVTGDDSDLSATDLGNVLIISEDGDSNDPDDNAAGGIISLDFDDLVEVNSIGLLDIDEAGSSITLYDEDSNLIQTVEIENLGENSYQEINFDVDNVGSIDINLAGSGAVTGIDYSPTQSIAYSNIYVFGDSLSETGNLLNVTTAFQESAESFGLEIPIIPPSPPYFEGRLSNGSIWIDNIVNELDLDLIPATELSVLSPGSDILSPVTLIDGNPTISPFFNGGTTDQSVNFAYALSTTGTNGGGELANVIPGMATQVEFFIADHLQANQAADDEALYILWGGNNDYFLPDPNPEQIVQNIETQIESLYGLGSRNFLVLNIPDLGQLPEANNPDLPNSPEELTELSDSHNLLLDSTADELEDTLTGANITLIDANSLFDDVLSNPAEFGLTNVTESFLDPVTFIPTLGANPDEYFFYDTLHPTEAGHAILSDFALDTLAIADI